MEIDDNFCTMLCETLICSLQPAFLVAQRKHLVRYRCDGALLMEFRSIRRFIDQRLSADEAVHHEPGHARMSSPRTSPQADLRVAGSQTLDGHTQRDRTRESSSPRISVRRSRGHDGVPARASDTIGAMMAGVRYHRRMFRIVALESKHAL